MDSKTLKIWRSSVCEDKDPAVSGPGVIVSVDKNGFSVQTGEGVLRILEVQLEGKKRMDTEAFLRGYRVEAGSRLGTE